MKKSLPKNHNKFTQLLDISKKVTKNLTKRMGKCFKTISNKIKPQNPKPQNACYARPVGKKTGGGHERIKHHRQTRLWSSPERLQGHWPSGRAEKK